MKKNIIGIIIFIIGIALIIGGIAVINYHSDSIPPLKGKNEELEKDRAVLKENSMIIFEKDKSHLNINKMDSKSLIYDLVYLSKKDSIDNITGKELKEAALKYFNISNLELTDIKCGHDHKDGSSDVLYYYNSETDKYDYNVNHVSNSSSVGDRINHYISDGKLIKKGNDYLYSAKIYYKVDGCKIASPCESIKYLDIYPTYDDAVNKTNKIMNAAENADYCQKNENGSYICDSDKISKGLKDKIKAITFYYKKVNDNFVFDKYEIK